MRLKCCSFIDMSFFIRSHNKKIVMIGAGVIGRVTVPEILRQYKLDDRVICYVDNNPGLWESYCHITDRNIIIKPLDYLAGMDSDSFVILLNVSRYGKLLRQLNEMESLRNTICYFMPMLCIHNFTGFGKIVNIKDYEIPKIPKYIHYMWLGRTEIPSRLRKCIESWKQYCPDYEIIQWNEDNYDINSQLYMKEAYESDAFGFVPDYARLDILYKYGGFYLDTDVELIRSLDELRYQNAFCGVEKWQVLNFGGCSGAVRKNEMIHKFLQYRKNLRFFNEDGSENRMTCGLFDTMVALENGYQVNGKFQHIGDMNIYPSEFFHPYDYMSGRIDITSNTFSIHRFDGGWMNDEMKKANKVAREKFEQLYHEALE